jgi:hypothetical protein
VFSRLVQRTRGLLFWWSRPGDVPVPVSAADRPFEWLSLDMGNHADVRAFVVRYQHALTDDATLIDRGGAPVASIPMTGRGVPGADARALSASPVHFSCTSSRRGAST